MFNILCITNPTPLNFPMSLLNHPFVSQDKMASKLRVLVGCKRVIDYAVKVDYEENYKKRSVKE